MQEQIKMIADWFKQAEEFINQFAIITEYKFVIFFILWIGLLCFIYYLRKNKIIGNAAKQAMEKMLISNMQGKSKKKKKITLKRNSLRWKIEKKFQYSRINKYFTFMSCDLWTAIIVILFGVSYLVAAFVSKNIITSLIVGMVAALIPIAIELFLAHRNYQKTDDNLMEFLNMLGNYSSSNSEITEVFSHIYNKLEDPLSSAIEECIYDAETNGPVSALDNLADKIEHPKFKEIIKNLKVSVKYSSDFKAVVENNRKIISDYTKSKQDRRAIAAGNTISLILCIIMYIVILFMLGKMVNIDIWYFMLHNTLGQIALFIAFVCVLFFWWKIYSIDR